MPFKALYPKFRFFRHLLCKEINTLIKIFLLSIHYGKGLVVTVIGIVKIYRIWYMISRGFQSLFHLAILP